LDKVEQPADQEAVTGVDERTDHRFNIPTKSTVDDNDDADVRRILQVR
jgi:hypothetical protein